MIASFCHSISSARLWRATDYFGYAAETSHLQSDADQTLLINRLTGKFGIRLRTASSAFEAGRFAPDRVLSGGHLVVSYLLMAHRNGFPTTALDPFVTTVTPANGAHLDPGSTAVVVVFGADMSETPPNSVLQPSGSCHATVADARWTSTTTLQFTAQVPRDATPGCTVEFGVVAHEAVVGGGWPAHLDGNTNPPGTNGEPNGGNYAWSYGSVAPLTTMTSVPPAGRSYVIDYSGTYHALNYEANVKGSNKNPVTFDFSWDATALFHSRATSSPSGTTARSRVRSRRKSIIRSLACRLATSAWQRCQASNQQLVTSPRSRPTPAGC